MSEDEDASRRRSVAQHIENAGAVAHRDFAQMAKYAAGRDQVVREIHIHLPDHGDAGLPTPPAWVTDPVSDARTVFGVPLLPNEYFTGREDTLTELDTALSVERPPRFLVLAGAAGVGKTQLAVEYVYSQRDAYDVIWWVRADQPETLLSDFVGLAAQAPLTIEALVRAEQGIEAQADAVRGWLERRDGWLLVFDNANRLADLNALLPRGGGGRILVTSRPDAGWAPAARVLLLDVLPPESASMLLRKRSGDDDSSASDQLVRELGCLPLALEQAGAFISQTAGFDVAAYLDRFRTRSKDLLDRGQPFGYEGTVNTTWNVAFDQLRDKAPDAIELLDLFAFFDPDDIPSRLIFSVLASQNDAEGSTDPLELADAATALREYGLVKLSGDGLFVHRLLQAVVRNGLDPDKQRKVAALAVSLVAAAFDAEASAAVQAERYRFVPHARAVLAHAEALETDPEAVSFVLDCVGSYLIRRGRYSEAVPLLQRALAIDDAPGGDPRTAIFASGQLGQALLGEGDLLGARRQFESAAARADDVLEPDDPLLVIVHFNLGSILRAQGDLVAARTALERATDVAGRVVGGDDTNVVVARAQLGNVLLALGDRAGARAEFERAIALGDKVLGPDNPDLVVVRCNLGTVLYSEGDLGGARAVLERAIESEERVLGVDHPSVLMAYNNLGLTLYAQGDLPAARDALARTIEVGERVLGPEHPNLIMPHNNLGMVLHSLRQIDAARDHCERAIELGDRVLGPDHPDLVMPRSKLGMVLLEQGDTARARTECQRAVEIGERVLGTDHPNLVMPRSNLAQVLQKEGELSSARALLEQTLEIGERVLGRDHHDLLEPHANLASVLQAEGHLAGARAEFVRAVELAERVFAPDHRYVGYYLRELGHIERLLNELPAAHEHLERALAIEESALEVNDAALAYLSAELGLVEYRLRNLVSARNRFARAATIHQGAQRDLALGQALLNLGCVERELSEHTAARDHLEQALVVEEAAKQHDDILIAQTLRALGGVLVDIGDLPSAQTALERAQMIVLAADNEDSSLLASILADLGNLFERVGELQQAKACLEWALAAWRVTSSDDPRAARILAVLGPLLESLGARAPTEPAKGTEHSVEDLVVRHREWIYELRRRLLENANVRAEWEPCLRDLLLLRIAPLTGSLDPEEWDLHEIARQVNRRYALSVAFTDAADEPRTPEALVDRIRADVVAAWDRREAELGEEVIREVERVVLLQVIDQVWPPHRAGLLSVEPTGTEGDNRPLDLELREQLMDAFLTLLPQVKVTTTRPEKVASRERPDSGRTSSTGGATATLTPAWRNVKPMQT